MTRISLGINPRYSSILNGVREFVIYSRRGCHLCEEMLEVLEPLCRGRASVTVHDVDSRPEWADAFGLYVPVLYVDGREVSRYQLNREAVIALLGNEQV